MNLGKRLSVEILMIVLIGLLLGLMGPFGTYPMPTGIRLIYWVGFILVGYLIFRPISFVADWISDVSAAPGWMATIMSTAVASFPLTILIALAIGGFRVTGNAMLLDGFGLLYLQVAAIGIGIFLLMRLLFGAEPDGVTPPPAALKGQPSPSSSPDAPQTPPEYLLHKRLPLSFAGPVAALGVEDHYVRVFGEGGDSEMLLMRLSDAIAEMDGADGLQVHRSWWVARRAVEGFERDGRQVTLLLASGLKVPVSRSNVSAVRRAGFLS